MQYASFEGFLRTLIYFIAIYYIIKILAKIFFPILLKKVVEKAGDNFKKQQQYSQQNSWQKKSSNEEISIDMTNAKKSRETKKVGDYVDYEEID